MASLLIIQLLPQSPEALFIKTEQLPIKVPLLGAIKLFNGWPIGAVQLPIEPPCFGAIKPLNGRPISVMKLSIKPPLFGAIRKDFTLSFLVHRFTQGAY